MVVLDRTEDVAAFVAKIGGKPFFPPFTAIGVANDAGALTGGFVFTGFNGDGIELSLAGRGVVGRDGWRAVLAYVFDQLGCKRLQMHTRKSNRLVRMMLSKKLQFHFEGTARRFYGNEHGLIFSLTADDLPAFRSRWRL